MYCENNLCIYCNQYKCTLNTIPINDIGLCTECILITIDEDTLIKEKNIIKYNKIKKLKAYI